jgi:hydrogenase nickel incorporation protein HypA/HybF
MHEVGIVQSTLDLALKQAKASGATQIHELRMRVGVMTGVVPEALTFAFEIARQGTLASSARLEIETVPLSCWCQKCQTEFPCADYNNLCPQCQQPSADFRKGRELELVSMEVS